MTNVVVPILTNFFTGFSWWLITLFILAGLLLWIGIVGSIKGYFFSRKHMIEFHENISDLRNIYGSLERELKNAKQVWICTWVGQSIHKDDVLDKCNVTRLILLDPEYSELKNYANQDDKNVILYQSIIIELSKKAIKKGIKTYWVKEPIISMIIYNPEKGEKNGWIRIGDFLPYGLPSDSPGYKVCDKLYPNLFRRMCDSYNKMVDINRDRLVTQNRIDQTEKKLSSNITVIENASG